MSKPTAKATQIISAIPYFSGIDEAALATVAQATLRQEYASDQVIFLEGESSAGLYVVESGWIKAVKMSPDGREQIIHFLGAGESFNVLSVFTGAPNPATAIALEPTVIWLIRREVMLGLLDTHPQLARAVIQKLAERVQHLVGLVEDISLRSVESRLARMLLKNAEGGTIHRERWATQAEMAARMGTVPDVLSRALRKLGTEGIIRVSRHQIQIINQEGLEKRARGEKE